MPTRDLVVAALAFSLALNPAAATTQEAGVVHVAEGACPFECCTYGRWEARRSIYLLTVPRSSAGVVAEVAAGDSVTAETGEVHTEAAPFVFESDRAPFVAGDTLWLLDYLGEGLFRVIRESGEATADLGFSPYGVRGGRLLGAYNSEWWVRIKTDSGVVGWTSHAEFFNGRDACSAR